MRRLTPGWRTGVRARRLPPAIVAGAALLCLTGAGAGPRLADDYVVFAYNDLGMHCMNEDFSELVVLPPFNTLRAQVIERGIEPDIVTEEISVTYILPSNTHSVDKTNFWTYAESIFGAPLPPDVGLGGKALSGAMDVTPHNYFEALGIPVTPYDDDGRFNPYPLAQVMVAGPDGGSATTYAVVPVSSEMSCDLCHNDPGVSTATDILGDHDRLHGTTLLDEKPVLCAACHADNALGTPGVPGVPNLSSAMHLAHGPRMGLVDLDNDCYACHPGLRTQCQRDVHAAEGVVCVDCHGGMSAVGDPAREPWLEEPRCGDCHTRPGFQFEQSGTLFKDSIGHKGVLCSACHGSPHAITPTVTDADNLQATLLQGYAGVIDTCLVCHTQQPDQPFFHAVDD